ncbi:MAG: hypothetical protein R3B69_00950 [Candidatus Paceibacterota bacterium]
MYSYPKQKISEQFKYLLHKRVRSALTLNTSNELFDSLGELLLFAAIMIGPIALVQTLGVYEPLLIFLVSIVLAIKYPQHFKEDVEREAILQKTLGIGVVLLGSLVLYSLIEI